jgi:hypothetical protein
MDRCMIRQQFMKYYEHHKEIPTVRKLLSNRQEISIMGTNEPLAL